MIWDRLLTGSWGEPTSGVGRWPRGWMEPLCPPQVPTRARFTFIYQQHRCDHHNSSSPTQQDMEGKCGGGERERERGAGGRKVEKGKIVKRAITVALQ